MEKPPRGEKQLRAEENLLRKAKEMTIIDDVEQKDHGHGISEC